MIRTIGFCGLAGAGKTTAALHLVQTMGATRMRFAEPLKRMLAALGCGAEDYDGAGKNVPSALLCGQTPRHAMQTLGTEWGRELIGWDLWVNGWKAAVERLPHETLVVVDDVRFENEAAAIRARDGLLFEILRPGQLLDSFHFHCSENSPLKAGPVIVNDGTQAFEDMILERLVTELPVSG